MFEKFRRNTCASSQVSSFEASIERSKKLRYGASYGDYPEAVESRLRYVSAARVSALEFAKVAIQKQLSPDAYVRVNEQDIVWGWIVRYPYNTSLYALKNQDWEGMMVSLSGRYIAWDQIRDPNTQEEFSVHDTFRRSLHAFEPHHDPQNRYRDNLNPGIVRMRQIHNGELIGWRIPNDDMLYHYLGEDRWHEHPTLFDRMKAYIIDDEA